MTRRVRPAAGVLLLTLTVSGAAAIAAGQGRMRGRILPPLSAGEWILGDPAAVGPWGDGKVYVLDLWGTWCRPCVRNIPELTSLQAEYGSRGLVVLGYSWEPPDTLVPFVRKMGDSMKYHVVSDVKETLLAKLTDLEAVEGFPYAFLVGRDGRVAWEGHPKDDDLAGAVKTYFARDRAR